MKIPKTIKIKKSVHNRIKRQRAKLSKVYLLGANSEGIVTQALRLKNDTWNGCEFMRAVTDDTMTRAYLSMIKKKCIPVGFANSLKFSYLSWSGPLRGWNWMMGGSINSYPGMVFVLYDDAVIAMTATEKRRRHRVKIEIV
jgi:hypothetical protein